MGVRYYNVHVLVIVTIIASYFLHSWCSHNNNNNNVDTDVLTNNAVINGHRSATTRTKALMTANRHRHRRDDNKNNDPDSGRSGARVIPPNIVLFMTDDQDVQHHSLNYMPRLNKLFRQGGMEFVHYYVPTGLCCPSRATILRGQYCHNTKVYDNGDLSNATYKSGAWDKFVEEGLENETFVTMLQSVGYETALIGKYMNGYGGLEAIRHIPPGFDHWMGMTDMSFYGPAFSKNGTRFVVNSTIYQTDFIRDWSINYMQSVRDPSKPFFLMVTPFAPHSPAIPARRHKGLFNDVELPQFDSFNPSDTIQRDRPAWIRHMPPLLESQIDDMTKFYRNRLRSLQAIDEAIESLLNAIHDLGLDDDTYFFYTSDNGQHFGDFRIPAGKRQAYETDVRVPFLVRGPSIGKGTVVTQVVQSVDLGPTFLDLATRLFHDGKGDPINDGIVQFQQQQQQQRLLRHVSVKSSYPMDGKSIVDILHGQISAVPNVNDFRWAALLEMYGGSSNIGLRYNQTKGYYQNHMYPNTYQALRIVNGPDWAARANWLYVEWCTGEQELYDMTEDPYQVTNLAPSIKRMTETRVVDNTQAKEGVDAALIYRLSRLLAWMGDCQGFECHSISKDIVDEHDVNDDITSDTTLHEKIRNRIPCFNPINWATPVTQTRQNSDMELRRKPFAIGLPVIEPFVHGFPFSDGDSVPNELLHLWEDTYQHYFH
jgi:N-acetylglucosamine-6-sulfatase